MICIELYDPLEIINEPLILEPQAIVKDFLPSPESLERKSRSSKRKTLKQVMPTQDVLVLGTMPRNVVDPKLIERKRERKSRDEEEIITTEKAIKRQSNTKGVNYIIKDGKIATLSKEIEEMKKSPTLYALRKRQSAIFPVELVNTDEITPEKIMGRMSILPLKSLELDLNKSKDNSEIIKKLGNSRTSNISENVGDSNRASADLSLEAILVSDNEIVFLCGFQQQQKGN